MQTVSREIVFVDAGVQNYQELIAGLPESAEVFVLSQESDGVKQMLEILMANAGDQPYSAIHLISHGSEARLSFGSGTLDSGNLDSYQADLQQIGSYLDTEGDILLYGCNVAQGDVGQAFISALASATGADVAASTDLTGSVVLGGDWVLEFTTGMIDAVAQVDLPLETVLATGQATGGPNYSDKILTTTKLWDSTSISISDAPTNATISSVTVQWNVDSNYTSDIRWWVNNASGTWISNHYSMPTTGNDTEIWPATIYSQTSSSSYTLTPAIGTPVNGTWWFNIEDTINDTNDNWDMSRLDSWSIAINYTYEPPKPDLIVSNASLSGSSVVQGGSIDLSYYIKNQGDAAAGYSYDYIYIDGVKKTDYYTGGLSAYDVSGKGGYTIDTSSLSVGTHTITVKADGGTRVTESSETNNEWSKTFTVNAPPKPDLMVYNASLSSTSVAQGTDIDVSYYIKNQGNGSAGYSYDYIYIDGVKKTDYYTGGLSAYDVSGKGGYTIDTSSLSVGTHTITVKADGGTRVTESSETNNEWSITINVTDPPKPNLVVRDIDISGDFVAGEKVTLRAEVGNTGNAAYTSVFWGAFGNYKVEFYVDGVKVATETNLGDVSIGEYEWHTTDYVISSSGSHEIEAKIVNTSGETTTADNARSESFTFTDPPKPNLVVRDIDISGDLVAGDTVTLRAEVGNAGNAAYTSAFWGAFGNYKVEFYVDGVKVATETNLGDVSVGEYEWHTTNYVVSSSGSHQIEAKIVSTSGESTTADNSRSESFTFTDPPKPNLVVRDIDISGDLVAGDTVTLRAEVGNAGNAAYTSAFWGAFGNYKVEFYVDGVKVATETNLGDVSIGDYEWHTTDYVISSSGSHEIEAKIVNTSGETTTADNARSESFTFTDPPKPNLVVRDIDISGDFVAGEKVTLRAEVGNTGNAAYTSVFWGAFGNYKVEFYVDGVKVATETNLGDVGIGEYEWHTTDYVISSSGSHEIEAKIVNTSGETTTADNARSESFTFEGYDDFGVSPDTAGTVLAGTSPVWYEGSLEVAGDIDWFSVELQENSLYNFRVEETDTFGGIDPQIRLVDAAGNTVGGYLAQPDGLETTLGNTDLFGVSVDSGGTYYLEVRDADVGALDDANDTGTYQIRAEAFEDDAPGTHQNAATIKTDGTTYSCSIDTINDVDWFQISLEEGNVYTIRVEETTSGLGGIDPAIRIVNAAGETVQGLEISPSGLTAPFGEVELSFKSTLTGTFYLEVRDADFDGGFVTDDAKDTGGYQITASSFSKPSNLALSDSLLDYGNKFYETFADFAKGAYHLSTTLINGESVYVEELHSDQDYLLEGKTNEPFENIFPREGIDDEVKGAGDNFVKPYADDAWYRLTDNGWSILTPAQLGGVQGYNPDIIQVINPFGPNVYIPDLNAWYLETDGIYHSENAAAFASISDDALFLSFRGTNDNDNEQEWWNTGSSPDERNWIDMSGHWDELAPFVSLVDSYVDYWGIDKVYVTGHSLGGAMALAYMENHPDTYMENDPDTKKVDYQAVTFAAPGYQLVYDNFDNWRDVIRIEIDGDIVPDLKDQDYGYVVSVDVDGIVDLDTKEDYDEWHSMDLYREVAIAFDSELPKDEDLVYGFDSSFFDSQGGVDHGLELSLMGEEIIPQPDIREQYTWKNEIAPQFQLMAGNDTLSDNEDFGTTDYFLGGPGQDTLGGTTLFTSSGKGVMIGGDDDDIYYVDHALDQVIERAGQGTDIVITSISYTLPEYVENLSLKSFLLLSDESIDGTGNDLNNIITGNNADNRLAGLGGNDSLIGGGGNDTYQFEAGWGNDTITDDGGRIEISAVSDIAELAFGRIGNNLIISHNNVDSITLQGFFTGSSNDQHQAGWNLVTANGANTYSSDMLAAQLPGNAPTLAVNTITVDEGGSVILTAEMIGATDSDTPAEQLLMTVSAVMQGEFFNNGTPATQFLLADIQSGQVTFVHDGSEQGASFKVILSDGEYTLPQVAGEIEVLPVNDAPIISSNAFEMQEGATTTVTTSMLNIIDPDNGPSELLITVSDVLGGQFVRDGQTTTQFTLDDVSAARVSFVHDGGESAPSFKLSVTDGLLPSAPLAANVTFTNVNDAPVATGGTQSLTTHINTLVAGIDLSAHFSDAEDAALDYSLLSGALPDGLSLDPISGFLIGTSTTPGVFNFTLQATDDQGASAEKSFSMVVQTPPTIDKPLFFNGTDQADHFTLGSNLNTSASGGWGDDHYLITNDQSGAVTINDPFGNNQISLDKGVIVADAAFSFGNLTLTLAGGATVEVPTANDYTFNLGSQSDLTLSEALQMLQAGYEVVDYVAVNNAPALAKDLQINANGNDGADHFVFGSDLKTLADGGLGDDTFVVHRAQTGDLFINDTAGQNLVQFDDGVTVSSFSNDTGQFILTLDNGAHVTIDYAANNLYQVGNSSIMNGTDFAAYASDNSIEAPVYQLVAGSDAVDVLTGTAANENLQGYAQNDTLDGGAGDDLIDGGLHDDTLSGGDGQDLFAYRFNSTGNGVDPHWNGIDGLDAITDFSLLEGDKLLFSDLSAGTENIDTLAEFKAGFGIAFDAKVADAGMGIQIDFANTDLGSGNISGQHGLHLSLEAAVDATLYDSQWGIFNDADAFVQAIGGDASLIFG